MTKKILSITFILTLIFSIGYAKSQEKAKRKSVKFVSVVMENRSFACLVPKNWEMQKTGEKKAKKGVWGIELLGPREEDHPTIAYITFYSEANIYFKDYKTFIERNSTDLFGEKGSGPDKYGPVEKVKLNKRIAYRFENEIKEYLHPESKSEDFVILKEKFYVIPSRKGFHVLHFMSPKKAYPKYDNIFNKIALSFRGI